MLLMPPIGCCEAKRDRERSESNDQHMDESHRGRPESFPCVAQHTATTNPKSVNVLQIVR